MPVPVSLRSVAMEREGDEDEDRADHQAMSEDDLRFEVKRLAQRVQVLQRDKQILQQEAQLQGTPGAGAGAGVDSGAVAALREELSSARGLLTMSASKLQVVRTFLALERETMAEVRLQLSSGQARMMQEMETKMNLFKETVLAREAALQHRFQRVKQELFRSREAEERLKVDLQEARNDRRALQKNLDDVDAELTIEKNKLKGQFESISSKIEMYQKEHAKEVKKLNDTMMEKERQRQEHENELAKWKVTLKLRVEEKLAVDKELADLKALRELEATRETEKLQQEQAALEQELVVSAQLREDNSTLRSRLETLQVQQEKLLDTHDSLQSDFKSLLAREKALRTEISGNSTDKGEMQRKLRSITEKVSTMEEDHAKELGALREVVEQKQSLLDSALEGREREGVRAENMTREVERLQGLLVKDASRVGDINAALLEMTTRKESLESKLLEADKEKAEIHGTIESLRGDRDDALNQSIKVQDEMKNMRGKLAEAEANMRDLTRKLSDDSSSSAEVERLKSELQQCEGKAEQQVLEIRGLKDTVRRECEERTELMVEVSELRDRIARLQRQQRSGTTMRSQSGGVDSSVQARQDFSSRQPEAGEQPGMLRQLTGSDSTPLPLGSQGRSDGDGVGGNSERDDIWSKQRKAAQQSSGKPKRVSKYRP